MDALLEKHDDTTTEKINNGRQYLAASTSALILLAFGAVMAWTSPTLPKLKMENATLHIDEYQEALIGSLMPMGAFVGSFPGGISAGMIGRKKSMLVSAVQMVISWAVLAAAQSIWYLYVGRLIAGFALGWGMAVQPIYIGEISTPDIRGVLGVMGQIHFCLGFLVVYCNGPYVSYFWLCFTCTILALIFFVSFLFMPETPHYLVLKGDVDGAAKALTWLRNGSTLGVKAELSVLQVDVEQTLRHKGTWKDVFTNYGNRKAILIIFSLMALQQFCGITAVLFYSQSIFERAGVGLSGELSTIVVGVVMTAASLVPPYFVEKVGRKLSIVASSVVVGIGLLLMGIFFLLEHRDLDVSYLGWLPLVATNTIISFNCAGLGPMPWVMMSEIFASNIRGNACALSSAVSWLSTCLVTYLFPPLMTAAGPHVTYFLCAFITFLGAILSHIFLFETKGKTLQEIQTMLNNK